MTLAGDFRADHEPRFMIGGVSRSQRHGRRGSPLFSGNWAYSRLNHTGLDAQWLFADRVVGVVLSVVLGLGFGGWAAAEAVHESVGAVPVHPGGGGSFHVEGGG